jgi:uncharacterized protein with PIN domain
MLKKLAVWLRISGIDSETVPDDWEDDLVLRKAIKSRRVLLTRDEELAKKASDYCKCILIQGNELEKQLKQVKKSLDALYKRLPSLSFCPKCNGRLEGVERKKVRGKVFTYAFKTHWAFWICGKCRRFYWIGSHANKIRAFLKRI